MNHLRFFLSFLLLCASINAQKPAPPPSSAPAATTNKTAEQKETEALQAIRRQTAVTALNSLADEARSYRDETLRSRVQARIADALWDQNPGQARTLFRLAWNAAEQIETGENDNSTSVPGRASKRPPVRPRTNLRSEVLRLAAKRDAALAEEFLAKLTASKDEGSKDNAASGTSAASSLSPAAIAQRLRLATETLEAGDVRSALRFADLALVPISRGAISFLIELRDKSPSAADERFAALLASAAADPSADANTVSLLTSYAFTPSMYVVVSNTGIPSTMSFLPHPAPDLTPALRAAYFRVASGILLRPVVELDQTSAGRAGTYYIASRLFPLFQQHAPDLAPLLGAQLTALRGGAQQALDTSERNMNRGVVPDDPAGDVIQEELQDRLARAQNADQRDRAYAFAAMRAADNAEARSRDFADKIEDTDTRSGVRRFVDYNLISGLLRKKNVAEALRLARKSDLTHAHRTGILRAAAEILAKTDREQAVTLLDESLDEARRIDNGTPESAYALVSLLALFAKIDPPRAWSVVSETVKAANAVPDFTGENGQVQMQLEGKFSIRMGLSLAAGTDLPEAFEMLAADDLFHALNTARDFKGEGPRALTMIAAARSILVLKIRDKDAGAVRLPD